MDEENEDLGGQLLGRLQRKPRTQADFEPEPPTTKGLTPSGMVVVIGAAVILMCFPPMFYVTQILFAVSSPPVTAVAAPRSISPSVSRSFKRVGRDVHGTFVLQNSMSPDPFDWVKVTVTVAGKKPVKPHPPLGKLPVGAKKTFTLVFANVPKGKTPIVISTEYKSLGSLGSEGIVTDEVMP